MAALKLESIRMQIDTAPIKVRIFRATWRYRRKRLVPTEFMPHSGYLIRSPPRNPKPGSSDLSASQPYRVLEPLKEHNTSKLPEEVLAFLWMLIPRHKVT